MEVREGSDVKSRTEAVALAAEISRGIYLERIRGARSPALHRNLPPSSPDPQPLCVKDRAGSMPNYMKLNN